MPSWTRRSWAAATASSTATTPSCGRWASWSGLQALDLTLYGAGGGGELASELAAHRAALSALLAEKAEAIERFKSAELRRPQLADLPAPAGWRDHPRGAPAGSRRGARRPVRQVLEIALSTGHGRVAGTRPGQRQDAGTAPIGVATARRPARRGGARRPSRGPARARPAPPGAPARAAAPAQDHRRDTLRRARRGSRPRDQPGLRGAAPVEPTATAAGSSPWPGR